MNKKKVFDVISTVIVALAHVLLILAIILAYRYFAIYPSLIASIVGIVVCIVVLVDIVFFVGLRYRDMAMKVIGLILAFFIMLGSAFGAFYVNKVNSTIGTVIDTGNNSNNGGSDKITETVNGVFAVRGEDSSKYISLKSFSGKKVGYVAESTEGVATVGQQLLKDQGIDFASVEYSTNDEMVTDLYDGKIDGIIILDGYKSLYSKTAESGGVDLSGMVNTFYDVQTFEKEVEITNTGTNVNIATDPFNILLIGYSRTDIGSPIGLADAIIVASVNPKTYTVSMLSIARDSYVPISCYGGTKDKINSARGTSRACFIETVENYTGMKMDFYMEADYEAVVSVVDALGGIEISNPVDFVLDGIEVPAGTYTAYGWQVLEFCRERHHMPNGDFDRQQHQKEVIIAIAEKLIKKADITLFLNAIEAAGDKFSTNLTLNQLTGMFNMILNTKNYTGLKVSKLIDFQQLRLTGYASWYYNYSMNLPLWIYKIYDGSYNEAIGHAQAILGMNVNTSNQTYSFAFDANIPYVRPQLYQDYYDEEHVDEPMPAYYPNLTGMLYGDVQAWAKENGIKLDVTFISPSDPGYDRNTDGYVISQSPRYGMLLKDYPTASITIMGDGTSSVVGELLDYTGMNYKDVEQWAKDHGYRYALRQTYKTADELEESKNNVVYKVDVDQDDEGDILKIRYYTICSGIINDEGKCVIAKDYTGAVKTADFEENGIKYVVKADKDTYKKAEENVVYKQDAAKGGAVTLHTYKYVECTNHEYDDGKVTTAPTCEAKGVKTYTCKKCGATKTEDVAALGHDMSIDVAEVAPTCGTAGHTAGKKCSRCDHTEGVTEKAATGQHTFGEWTVTTAATCTAKGIETRTCSVCGATETREKDMVAHTWGETVTREDGTKYRECSVCHTTEEVTG
ncbi:MAG: LCP family protein [Erysipelotrichaceae bacterium]